MKKLLFLLIIILALPGCQTQSEQDVSLPQTTQEPAKNKPETIMPVEIERENPLYDNYDNITLVAKLEGHDSKLWTLDTSQHNTFVTGGQDGKIILWDAATLQPIYSSKDHTRLVEEIFFLNNGDVLSISDDNSVRKLNVKDGQSQKIYSGVTKEFTFSKDETLIVISTGDRAVIYNYDDFSKVQTVEFTDGCFDIRLSNDNNFLFNVGHNGKVQKFSVQSGQLISEYEGLTGDVHCMELSADNQYIAAGATNTQVRVWNVETTEQISKYSHYDGLYDLDISEDNKFIASVGCDKQIILSELETGKFITRLRHQDEIHAVAIDPNCNYIVAGGYDSVVYVWGIDTIDTQNLQVIDADNAQNIELIGQLKGHTGWVFDAVISHNNKWIASAERSDKILVNIWDIHSKTVLYSFETNQAPVEMRFTADDHFILLRGESGDFRIWDIANETFVFSSSDINMKLTAIDLSKDSKTLVTGTLSGEVILWDFETMDILKRAQFDREVIAQTVFSKDDTMIAFSYAGSTEDFCAHVISTDDLSEIYTTDGHTEYNYTLKFADTNDILASCSGDTLIKLWDSNTGEHLMTFEGHTGKVMDVDFSLSEDILITGSAHDRTVRIWNVVTGEELLKLNPRAEVQAVEMSSDGRFFISTGEGGTISIWAVAGQ